MSSSAIRSVLNYLYLKAGDGAWAHRNEPINNGNAALWGTLSHNAASPKVAFVCDEMTWQDFSDCCEAVFLHPLLWREQMDRMRPDFFLCESAWSGIDMFPNVWRGRIYRDNRVSFENRYIILSILDYCREHRIPAIFWNKEDPVFFQHPIYDFTQTALLFDIIFTTAQECVQLYQSLGHQQVYLMPFGVDTGKFCPSGETARPGTAVFAGSWFGDHPQRCRDLTAILDYCLEQGWQLDIFDRKHGTRAKKFQFPKKYRQYIHSPVPYEETPGLYRRYEYAINVNTVTDSSTMCSRRLLQLASSGNTIISNHSQVFSTLSCCLDVRESGVPGIVLAKGNLAAIEEKYATQRHFENLRRCAESWKERSPYGAGVG